MLQDLPDPDWILCPDLVPALTAMREAGLTLDLLVKPHQLAAIRRFAALHPDLPMVLDHCGKPDIAGRAWEGWAGEITAIAHETPILCKLSGLVAEAASGWAVEDLRPYVDHVIARFGPARIMWGSDWPVLTLNGSYKAWRDAAAALTVRLAPDAKAQIFGGTAMRFYGIV